MNREELSELLSGYLDGELNDDEVTLVERVLLEDQDARSLLDELRQMVHFVGALPRHDAPLSIAEDIAAQLERSELLGDTDAVEFVAGPKGRSPWSSLLSMAAGIVVVAAGVLWYTYDRASESAAPTMASAHKSAGDESRVFRTESAKEDRDDVASERAALPGSSFAATKSVGGDLSLSSMDKSEKRSDRLARKNRAKYMAALAEARSGLPPVPVPPVPYFDKEKLLAAASVEQILVADGRVSHLRGHSFHNEEMQLAISARDGKQSGEFARRLVDALKSQNVVNAATASDDTPLAEISGHGFFLQGASGVNYRDERQQQILVYIPVSDRDALLDEIEQWSEFRNEVELQVGRFRLRGGLDTARAALDGMLVSRSDKPAYETAGLDLAKYDGAAGPGNDESTAEPADGIQGFIEMMEVLAQSDGRQADAEDLTARKKGSLGDAAVESEESDSRAPQPTTGAGEPPSSPATDSNRPEEKYAAGQKGSAKAEGVAGTGSLVDSRMQDLKRTSKIRWLDRRRAGREREGEVGRVTSATRPATRRGAVRRIIEPGPEQFVTLVFQIIPDRPTKGKAKVSKRPVTAKPKKAQPSNERPRVRSKTGKTDKPVRK